jgi:CRISPR type IV-associated protein Csf3
VTLRQRVGVPLTGARLVRVTAHLRGGAALDPRWPLPLDGLLASAARRRRLGTLHGGARDLHVEDLPLGRYTRCRRWFWLASCAAPDQAAEEELHYWHRRVPHAAAEKVTGSLLPPQIYEGHGRYRAYRMPLVITVTTSLTWLAAGDPDAIADLLDDVWCVGKKRSQGEGAVTGWEAEDAGDPDVTAVLWRDGRIGRPVPARAAAELGVPGAETVRGCYRPPYWRPPQDHGPAGSDGPFARQWQEVLAPWTTQPPTAP